MRWRPAHGLLILAAALVAGGAASTGPASGAPRAAAGVIVFSSDRATANPGEVYSLAPGTAPRDVTRSPYADFLVAAAPRGGTIAFWRTVDGDARLFLARLDGSRARAVSGILDATGQYPPSAPVFSPDGSRLAVTRWVGPIGTLRGALLLVDVRAATARVLAASCGFGPVAWSPDGSLIACVSGPASRSRVAVYDLSGRLRFSLAGGAPLWSQSGLLSVSGAAATIIVDARGRTVARLAGQGKAWSPDGRLLALSVPNRLVLAEPALGDTERVLASAPNWSPYWVAFTPDGRSLGFDGSVRPELVPVAGGAGRSLPAAGGVWSPDGRYAFGRAPRSVVPGATSEILVGGRAGQGAKVVGRFLFDDHGTSRLVWPADSRRVLYEWSAMGSGDLYSVAPDGSGLRRLTRDPLNETGPSFSPQGTRLAYSSSPLVGHLCEGCPMTLWSASADASSPVDLTGPAGSGTFDSDASWSPDGSRIAFVHAGFSSTEIDVMNADGTARAELVAGGTAPAWSPDGSTIAYVGEDGIHAVDASGGNQRLLRAFATIDSPSSIAWSRDGTLLAYTGEHGLYVIAADGSGPARLVTSALEPAHPSFSPDGRQIAFSAVVSARVYQHDVFVVGLDGSGLHAVAASPFDDTDPSWG